MKNVIFTKETIKQHIKNRLWGLDKPDIINIAIELKVEFKKRDTKDSIIDKIWNCNDVDYIKIYEKYKNSFGLHPNDAQKILKIDNKTLKKLCKKGFIGVAYTKKDRVYGNYVDIPYYNVMDLVDVTYDALEAAIEKHCKPATEKQLKSLEKAREAKTCIYNKKVLSSKYDPNIPGKYDICLRLIEKQIKKSEMKNFFKEYLENKDKYVILDTETTGLDRNDEIIEIAIIDMDGNELVNTRIFTEKEISYEAYCVHGISKESLVGKPTIKELNNKLKEIFKGRNVLIYNDSFDVGMLYRSGFEGEINSECIMKGYVS